MKTMIKSAILFSAVSLLAACGGEDGDTSDNSVSVNYHDIRATLQGSIFNAIDGTRITDNSLAVTLVQGSDYRLASVQTGDHEFSGDYAISSIPTSTANNITYRVVSKADGYQAFEAAVTFDVATDDFLQDKRINLLANMYMYPIGSFASDVKVNVTFNNEPVANTTVLLNPRTGSNQITTDTSNTLFTAQNGFQGAMQATTDASGVATFAAANLVLGGQYNIDVMPTTHEGIQLAANRGTATYFTVGSTTNIRNVTMAEAVPGNDNGLYVTSASNSDADALNASGVLTIGFSRTVSLVDERNIDAILSGDTVNAVLNSTTAPDSRVNATLSADGLTLTLTPIFTTAPVAFNDTNNEALADDNLVVTYSNVLVRIADTTDNAVIYNVFTALDDETGANPSAAVQTTKDF